MAMNHPPLVPFRIPFIARTEAEFASELASAPPPPSCGASLVVTANVAHIVELRRNPRFRQAYRHAWRATADGTPVYLYARLRGARLPERLTGSGCFAKLMPLLDAGRHRCVFVAPTNEVGELCRNWLLARGFSEDQVAVIVPGEGLRDGRRQVGRTGVVHRIPRADPCVLRSRGSEIRDLGRRAPRAPGRLLCPLRWRGPRVFRRRKEPRPRVDEVHRPGMAVALGERAPPPGLSLPRLLLGLSGRRPQRSSWPTNPRRRQRRLRRKTKAPRGVVLRSACPDLLE